MQILSCLQQHLCTACQVKAAVLFHRHSCKRKLAELETAAVQSTVPSHNTPQDAFSRPVPQQQAAANQHRPSSQNGYLPTTTVAPSSPKKQLAEDGNGTQADQGSSHSPQPQVEMPALHSGQPVPLLSARQRPSGHTMHASSRLHQRVIAGSQLRQQAAQLQSNAHQAQQGAGHQQAAQQQPGSQVCQKGAEAGSSRRLEQPTASTGTSRPEPRLASG